MKANLWIWAVGTFLFISVVKWGTDFTTFERTVLTGLADILLVLAMGFQMVANAVRDAVTSAAPERPDE